MKGKENVVHWLLCSSVQRTLKLLNLPSLKYTAHSKYIPIPMAANTHTQTETKERKKSILLLLLLELTNPDAMPVRNKKESTNSHKIKYI